MILIELILLSLRPRQFGGQHLGSYYDFGAIFGLENARADEYGSKEMLLEHQRISHPVYSEFATFPTSAYIKDAGLGYATVH
jgi:hypothetical protein